MRNIIKITILIIMTSFVLSSNIFAVDDIFSKADDWIATGKANAGRTLDTSELTDTSNLIYNIFFAIGIAVAVIVGAILGIQFMTAGVDKKVEVKKALVPYIVSCIIIFGSFGIWKLTVQVLKSVDPITTTSSSSSGASTSGGGYGGGGRKLLVKKFLMLSYQK